MNAQAMPVTESVESPSPRRRPHRALRILLIILAVLVAFAVLVRLVLDPIATHETRKALAKLDGLTGDFSRVHVTLLPPGYTITRFKLSEERRDGTPGAPLLYVERAHAGLALRDLVRGKLVASLRLESPKITVRQPPPAAEEKKAPAKAPDLSAQLAQAPTLQVARVELVDGQILFRAYMNGAEPKLWIHDLELTAQNLVTRRKESQGRPATVSARGVVGRSGDLSLFVSADPLAHPLSFAGETSVRGLQAAELYDFIAPKTGMQIPHGTIDLFATFRSEKGLISGGVKPVLKNLTVSAANESLWTRAKAWLADKAIDLSSDRVPERNAVATSIPIKGKLTKPDIQLWPAVLGVVRNAYVAGLESGFASLPPPVADKPQGTLEQAKKALQKDEGPPKAQPAPHEKGNSTRRP